MSWAACCVAIDATLFAGIGYTPPEFAPCEYCGREPVRGQRHTACIGCGGPLRRKNSLNSTYAVRDGQKSP